MVRITSYGDVVLYPEDFFELVMSVIWQAGVTDKLSREDVLRIAERCGVPAHKVRFLSDEEYLEQAMEDLRRFADNMLESLKNVKRGD